MIKFVNKADGAVAEAVRLPMNFNALILADTLNDWCLCPGDWDIVDSGIVIKTTRGNLLAQPREWVHLHNKRLIYVSAAQMKSKSIPSIQVLDFSAEYLTRCREILAWLPDDCEVTGSTIWLPPANGDEEVNPIPAWPKHYVVKQASGFSVCDVREFNRAWEPVKLSLFIL